MTDIIGQEKPSLEELAHGAKHDMLYYEKRSTAKVVPKGQTFTAPESYGKLVKRRPATEDEEKTIANGDWVSTDVNGKKTGEVGHVKTQMPGREHLLKHDDLAHFVSDPECIAHEENADDCSEFVYCIEHHGVKGMHWGVRRGKSVTGVSRARGALIDRNDRGLSRIRKGYDKAPEKHGIIRAKKATLDKRISKLEAQNVRLKNGNVKFSDRIATLLNANEFNLLVSRRPK